MKYFTIILNKMIQMFLQQKKNILINKKDNITYVVDWESKFRFLVDEISNPGKYCVDHNISERFYSLLSNTILA